MNKSVFKIIGILVFLGILTACYAGPKPTATSTINILPTKIIQPTSTIIAAPTPIDAMVETSPSIGFSWEFGSDGNLEGWVVVNEITSLDVLNGNLNGLSAGNDPFMFSPGINIDANNFTSIEIRLKATSGEAAQIFFTTSSDIPFDFKTTESIRFLIIPNGQFHTYVLDMSSTGVWNGTINQLRLDPIETPASFEVDYIRILKPVGLSWEFESDENPEWWVATNEITDLQASQGNLSGLSTGNDPFMFSPAFSIDANNFSTVEIRMKTTSNDFAQLFFNTESDDPFDFKNEKSIYFSLYGDNQFHTYFLDMKETVGWNGNITLLRFDPLQTPSAFEIDYIRITR
jgi:hypothetical protein